ncbi:hypothetical protein [Homoserinimonas hongtaonis]|uniref:DUF4287 domain-containing protein n=1 Tax=Homoserinimonas hongtaonis TaxID=2079791 RepID=A0A2U1T091_9MICO|nr:hypothetical protein [Salinibacterium hongtaonis]PWB97279.1 hypothetical protein DF220_05130 [Salinibacterium hongtaonis]
MVAVSPSTISDTKLMAATGKTRGEWHALLDAENAPTWSHTQIAAWLHREHRVDGWWAQGITVGYEQARGMRLPGQQPDGTFAAGISRTVDGDRQTTLDRAVSLINDHLDTGPDSVSRDAKHPTARWRLADGTGMLVTVSPAGIGTVNRSRVALTRLRLAGPESLAPAKAELAEILNALAG